MGLIWEILDAVLPDREGFEVDMRHDARGFCFFGISLRKIKKLIQSSDIIMDMPFPTFSI